jgi:type IV pilus assembly protein PilY1
MRYSIPSSVSAVDTDYNGFVDRFYVGDTGARMWAFEIGSTLPASWTAAARWIFSSYSGILGPSDTGRKIFYPPSVVFEFGYANLAFGTGDREHPLNTAVVDRMYSLKDRGQTTVIRETNVPSELVDVTADLLQVSTDETVIQNLLNNLESQYGWYIRLEHPGEKVLAPPLTFFYSYYTTYTPDAPPPADPCEPPVLGTGRLYVVDYKTGESVFNYDVTNDSIESTNTRASNAAGDTLLKSDRVQTLGSGIPSGVVPILPPDGTVALLVGVGGGLPQPPPPDKDITIQLYCDGLMGRLTEAGVTQRRIHLRRPAQLPWWVTMRWAMWRLAMLAVQLVVYRPTPVQRRSNDVRKRRRRQHRVASAGGRAFRELQPRLHGRNHRPVRMTRVTIRGGQRARAGASPCCPRP